MSKVWEFAIGPKEAAIIGGCLVLAGVVLSGAGFVTGLMVAPRYMALQAKAAPAPILARATPVQSPAPVDTPKPAIIAAPIAPADAATPQAPIGTGLESTVLALSPTPAKNAPAPVSAPAPLPIRLAVQVGSFSIEKNARDIVERLTRLGYPAAVFPTTDAQNRRWSVVQVGPYGAYESASRTVLELSRNYRLQPVIIPLTIPLAGF